MTTYVFETITQAQAAAFGANDYLVFISGGASASQVSVSPYSDSLGGSGINLTYGSKTVTFGANLATASQETDSNHIVFNDQSTLLIGSNGADTALDSNSMASTGSTPSVGAVIYGLGGNDIINLGAGNDYAYGGTGADSITGANGNYHVYGNAIGASGMTDGADTITLGNGSNYVQGNAGNDVITVGTDGTAATATAAASGGSGGYNRIFGGNDMDTITVHGGVGSIAMVNGNMGNDVIRDTSAGNNTLRGGQGNDMIIQSGASHDVIMGDNGSDTIMVSGVQGHVALMTGGSDGSADYFNFATVGAGSTATVNGMTYYQEITDFTHGTDKIDINGTVSMVGHSSTVFASVADAQVYAASQLSATGGDQVSALSVGTSSSNSTYLFYNDTATGAAQTGTATYGIIHLDSVSSSAITASDFI